VVGSPIAHSKSPLLHEAAYRVLGLDWSYVRTEIAEGQLASFVAGLDASWRGLSVTMPLKNEAFDLSASQDAHASYTGAVNSLAISHASGRAVCHGYNTDVFGITESLRAAGQNTFDHAAIIGGGATALSALVALDELGFQRVSVALRDPNKGAALSSLANRLGIDMTINALNSIHSLAPVDVAISTVPGSAELRFDNLPRTSSATLLDVAYDVWPSPRSSEWTQRGGIAISGLSMLAFQAIKQVRIFVADAPDVALPNEAAIREAMFASVGLNEFGL